MPFPLDAAVLVKSIARTGRVVETGRNGRYRVRVGGVVMTCREEDLGDPGLRKGKLSYFPVRLEMKHTLTLRR